MLDNNPDTNNSEIEILGYFTPEGNTIITDVGILAEKIKSLINTLTGAVLIAFEGGPGAGKSHVASKIAQLLDPDFNLIIHEMDRHLGTERGTKARREVFDNEHNFRTGYCDDKGAAEFLNKIILMQAGETLKALRWYSREEQGRFVEGDAISIPRGNPRVILFPGSGAGRIIRATEADHKFVVFVYTPLIVAARAKARRAIQRGGGDAKPEDYEDELRMVVNNRCLPSMTQDAIYFDNTAGIEDGENSY